MHRCPGPGCRAEIPLVMAFCKPHWMRLGKSLRDQIWASWHTLGRLERAGADADVVEHRRRHNALLAAAVDFLQEQLAPQFQSMEG
jgi:hypothetical protein